MRWHASRPAAPRSATWSPRCCATWTTALRALLAAASVLGADFDSGLAAAVAGTSQDAAGALSAAETCGLVTRQPDRPGSWWFTHALVRDGIYASLGEDQRIALHAAAAAALEPLARQAPERGGEIAAHLLRAAPDQATLRRAAGWAADGGDGSDGGARVRGRGPVPGHRADRGGKRRRRRSRARGAADRAGHRGVPGRSARREPAARGRRRGYGRAGRAARPGR